MAGIRITKLVHEHHDCPISVEAGYATVGDRVDQYLALALDRGDDVQEVSVEIGREEWHNMMQVRHGVTEADDGLGPDRKLKARRS